MENSDYVPVDFASMSLTPLNSGRLWDSLGDRRKRFQISQVVLYVTRIEDSVLINAASWIQSVLYSKGVPL